jgi:hypothetical protein
VEGDADAGLGGYVNRLAQVVERILLQRSTLTAGDLDGFLALDADQPAEVGIYLRDGEGSVDDAIRALLFPLLCYRIFKPTGDLFVAQLRVSGASKIIPSNFIKSIRRDRGVRHISRFRMLYDRSWTVQTEVALGLEEIDPDRQAFVQAEHRELEIDNTATAHLRAEPYEAKALLTMEAQAQAEAQRQVDLSEAFNCIFEVELDRGWFDILPGQTVRMDDSRLGVTASRSFVVLGTNANYRSQTMSLTLWG